MRNLFSYIFVAIISLCASHNMMAQTLSDSLFWAKRLGTLGQMTVRDVKMGKNGMVYVCGFLTNETLVLDNITLPYQEGKTAFIGCLNGQGQWQWGRRFGTLNSGFVDRVRVHVLDDNSVIVTGSMFTLARPVFGPLQPRSEQGDAFAARLSCNGTWLWATMIGTYASDFSYASVLLPDQSVILACATYFQPGDQIAAIVSDAGYTGIYGNSNYFARIDSNGRVRYVKAYQIPVGLFAADGTPTSMALTTDTTFAITGQYNNRIRFGTDSVIHIGPSTYIAKFNINAKLIWLKDASYFIGDDQPCLASNRDGNVVQGGGLRGTVQVGGSTYTSQGQSDVFVVKYGPAGNVVWAAAGGGPGTDAVNQVAVSPSGTIVVGAAIDSGRYGNLQVTSASGVDNLLATLSPSGTWTQVRTWGAPNRGFGPEGSTGPIAFTNNGSILFAGISPGARMGPTQMVINNRFWLY